MADVGAQSRHRSGHPPNPPHIEDVSLIGLDFPFNPSIGDVVELQAFPVLQPRRMVRDGALGGGAAWCRSGYGEPPMSDTKTLTKNAPDKKAGSKIDKVTSLMRRKNGASLEEMVKATGWLPHTTHAALSGLRKKGHAITRTKEDGLSRYRIEDASS